ncbi:D-xylose transport system substrate-binding protein [Clostridium cavendishii DSM 21758]|uniref:D-xylose transport system substrate-binding protein n=1 Tax=Clostridium cavendishii DSM 21758 TaxID=1121302 RepID=A0A1M6NKQ5_9CLOT|nr:substrate-binding domain-containing protein [Clostridium cavendishii]SHJ96279.1 D-xylose transport system substrate-binding protein [Clostridium cavendishii DSM 21758]
MYLSIPNDFFVPIYYIEKNILDINNLMLLENSNYAINLIKKRNDITIGISLPKGGGEARWPKDKAALERYATEQGVTLKFTDSATTAAEQYLEVEKLISQGIDVLILVPVDLSAAANIVEMAHKSGIKVVAYDRLIKNADLDLYVSYDNVAIGELQGRYLIQKVPKGNYIILSGSPSDNNSKLIKDGAMEFIRPLANIRDINIVTDEAVDNWNPDIAYKIVKDSLVTNNNKINAILAPNDAIACAVIKALEEQGLAGKIPVTGQDAELSAVKRIVAGTQAMTVFADIREEAKTAIDAATKLARGQYITTTNMINNGKIDVPSILIRPILVDRNNINDTLIKSGYLKLNEVYDIYS